MTFNGQEIQPHKTEYRGLSPPFGMFRRSLGCALIKLVGRCDLVSKVTLGQRPEHIHLDPDAAWRGEVILVEPTGADTYVVVRTGVGLITVRTPPSTQVLMGDLVGLSVSGRHNNWFDAQSGLRLV